MRPGGSQKPTDLFCPATVGLPIAGCRTCLWTGGAPGKVCLHKMTDCKVCNSHIKEFIDFGQMPKANGFLASDEEASVWYRLAVGICPTCQMVQLMESPKPNQLFDKAYPFYTGTSDYMKAHFRNLALDIARQEPKFVLEIGGNDGTFLSSFEGMGIRTLNIEPSPEQARRSMERGIRTMNKFCTPDTLDFIEGQIGSPDVIVATNTFCHIPDIYALLKRMSQLNPKPQIVFEDPYLGDIVEKVAYDQFYDEHIFYFTAQSVCWMADRLGYDVYPARIPTHGGSVRYRLVPKDYQLFLDRFRASEVQKGLTSYDHLRSFAFKVRRQKEHLESVIRRYAGNGYSICAYGATSKSTTILNYCDVADHIDYVVDSTPEKQNRRTPGSNITIVPPDYFKVHPRDVCLMLAWNHWEEIQAKESWYKGIWVHPHDPS